MAGHKDRELNEEPRRLLRFDSFVVDPDARLLRRGDEPVQLTPKVFAVLLALLEQPGRVVPKEELIGKVWPDSFVSDANLTQTISALRKALGERAQDRRYVVTIPGAGYSFGAPVEWLAEGEAQAAVVEPAATERSAAGGPEPGPGRRRWRIAVLAAALVLAAAVTWFLLSRAGGSSFRDEPETGAPGHRLSVAVLGFKNLSGRGAAQWLSTALPEMLATELAAAKQVRVIPGESVARVRLPADSMALDRADLKRIEDVLGSDLLVTGSFLKLGESAAGRLRLDVQVLRLPSGEPLVSLAETGTEAELFELVSRTGGRLRAALGVAGLTPQQARAARALLPSSPEAARLYTAGLARLRSFDAAGAREILQRAARVDARSAVIRSALSQAWADLGEDAKAVQTARQAVSLAGMLPQAERLAIQARLHEVSKDWDKASDIYRSLWTFYPDDLEYGLRLATTLAEAGRGAESLEAVAALRQLPPPDGDDPRIDLAEANAAKRLADLDTQMRAAEAAAAKGGESGEDLVVAQALLLQGEVLIRRGTPRRAVALFEQAIEGFQRAGDRIGVARALTLVGVALREQGDLDGAEARYREALALAERLGSLSGVALQRANLGVIYQQRGDLRRARESLELGRVLYARLGDRVLEARTLDALGTVLCSQGELAEARNAFEEVLETSRATGNRRDEARAMHHLGIVFALQGRLGEARRLQEQAFWIFRGTGDFSLAAAALADSAEVLIRQGDLPTAKTRLDQALAVKRHAGDKIGTAEVIDSRAALAYAAGDLRSAGRLNEQMLASARRLGSRALEANGLLRRGRLRRAAGDLEGAWDSLDAALRVSIEMGAGLQASDVRLELAALALARQRFAEAEQTARTAADWYASRYLAESEARAWELLAEAQARQGRAEAAREAAARALQARQALGEIQ